MTKEKTIAIIAPAAALKETEAEKLELGLKFLKDRGFQIKKATNLTDKHEIFPGADSFLAGNTQSRCQSTIDLIQDPEVDIIWSLRGGYGCMHILGELSNIDLSKINKTFFGYSDLTALFLELKARNYPGKIFHAPMLTEISDLDSKERQSLNYCLDELESFNKTAYFSKFKLDLNSQNEILGGNLTLITSLIGSKHLPSFDNKILFLEDCNEASYKIDRMFQQLFLSGLISKVKELWLGEALEADYNISDIDNYCKKHSIKLVQDLPFGHKRKLVLPLL